jgi:hypothetical protein
MRFLSKPTFRNVSNLKLDISYRDEQVSCLEFISLSGRGAVLERIISLIVGYQSGIVCIVSIPQGTVLIKQRIHSCSLIRIKLRSCSIIPLVGIQPTEDIALLFEDSNVVLIEGSTLIQTIRSEYLMAKNLQPQTQDTSLTFRKYHLKHGNTTTVRDLITLGQYNTRKFHRSIFVVWFCLFACFSL